MARKPRRLPVADYSDLGDFCHAKELDMTLAHAGGVWTLSILDGDDLLVREQVRGDPPGVFDQLALDCVIGLAQSGRIP